MTAVVVFSARWRFHHKQPFSTSTGTFIYGPISQRGFYGVLLFNGAGDFQGIQQPALGSLRFLLGPDMALVEHVERAGFAQLFLVVLPVRAFQRIPKRVTRSQPARTGIGRVAQAFHLPVGLEHLVVGIVEGQIDRTRI